MSHTAIDIDTDELQSEGDLDVYYPREEKHVEDDVKTPPDKKVIEFAATVAVLENLATASSSLAFVWATVVLLGGFATALDPIDFWVVAGILLVEGVRILSGRNQIEWHQSVSLEHHELMAAIIERDPEPSETPWTRVLSVLKEAFESSSRRVSTVLSVFQFLLAIACVALSIFRLSKHNYGSEVAKAKNGRSALMLFYCLALLEAGVFLGEKAYWSWMITVKDVFNVVSNELALRSRLGRHVARRFFYDVYGSSVSGSVFNAWKMDLFSFGLHLVSVSDIGTPSFLMGAIILSSYVEGKFKKTEELRSIGINKKVVRCLAELTTMENSGEQQYIGLCAARIIATCVDVKYLQITIDMEKYLAMGWRLVDKSDDALNLNVQNQGILVGFQILSQVAKDKKMAGKITRSLKNRGIIDKAKKDCQIAYGFQQFMGSLEYCDTFKRQIVDEVAQIPATDRPLFPLVEMAIDIIIKDGPRLYAYYRQHHTQKHIQLFRNFLFSLVNPEWKYFGEHTHVLYSKVITAVKDMAILVPTFLVDFVREIDEERLRIHSFNLIALILRKNNEAKRARDRVQAQQICGSITPESYVSLGEVVLQRLVRAEAIHDYHIANLASEVIEGLDHQGFQILMDKTKNDPLKLINMIMPPLRQYNVPKPDTLLYFVKFIAAVAEKTDTSRFCQWPLREEILSTLRQVRRYLFPPPPPPDSSQNKKERRYFGEHTHVLHSKVIRAMKEMAILVPAFSVDLVREIGEGRLRIRSFNLVALILRKSNEAKRAEDREQPQQIYGPESYVSLGEVVLQRLVRAEAIHDYHFANLASEVIEGLDHQGFQILMDKTKNDPLKLINMIMPPLRQYNVPKPDTLLYFVKFIAAVAEKTDTSLFQKWPLRKEILSTLRGLRQIRHDLPPAPPVSSQKRRRYFEKEAEILDRAILLFNITK